MKALLLAAGVGARLRPITDSIPKCLVPIQGRPLLEYWLEFLVKGGISPILINLHYMAEKVQEYIETSPYKEHIQSIHEKKLLGTGGTLLANRDFFKAETFLVIYADNLSKFDLQEFIKHHQNRPRHCEITMMTFHSPTPQSCGIVELDQAGVLQAFHEKVEEPPTNLANAAVYLFEPSIFEELEKKPGQSFDISKDIIPYFVGKIYTYFNFGYHRDIGTPESLNEAQKESIFFMS